MNGNILLINPAVNSASQNRVINKMIVNVLPTSLGTLAGFLHKAGINGVHIVDEQVDPISDNNLIELITSLQPPKIIGLSVLTISSKRAYELVTKIKKIDPGVLIVLGNIHPTVLPEEALMHEGVDVVVRGEGEETLVELAQMIFHQKDYKQISGISFRHNSNIIHNPNRSLIIDLDKIPPFPFNLFENSMSKYNTFGVVVSSRGCPFNCTFCSSRNVSSRRYRYFSPERVISEIKLLANRYNQKTIWIIDDNPVADKKRFYKILDGIIADKLNQKVQFHGSMRGDTLDDQILEKAKKANFKVITFGLETTSESLMRYINKGETVEQVLSAIRMTDAKGIAASATLIFGLPTETRSDRWSAIKTVGSLPLSSVRFNTIVPYPGTPMYEEMNRQGKILIKKDWENFAVQYMWEGDDLPYVPDGNNRYELLFDTMFANFSFYFSIKGLKRMIKSSFAGGNVIQLKSKWYLHPKTIYRLLRVFLYLARRFVCVSYKVLLKKK